MVASHDEHCTFAAERSGFSARAGRGVTAASTWSTATFTVTSTVSHRDEEKSNPGNTQTADATTATAVRPRATIEHAGTTYQLNEIDGEEIQSLPDIT